MRLHFLKDNWLSECLGVDCFNLCNFYNENARPLPDSGRVFATVKLPLSDDILSDNLKKQGFREINHQLTFQKNLMANHLTAEEKISLPSGCNIGIQLNLENPNIFSHLFVFDRFNEDQELPKTWSENIKRKWISGASKDKKFIVTYCDNNVVGFILFNTLECCEIELVCLLEEFRGKGLARAMLEYLQDFSLNNNIYKLRVGTQKNNIYSIALYEKLGFVVESEKLVLHFSRGLESYE